MNTKEETIYIEVYSVLELLGKQYINKIPQSLYSMIENNVTNIRALKYKSLKEINKNNIQKKSLAIIALLHINYWCKSEKEKNELNQKFANNFLKNEKEKREEFNPDNMFKKKLNVEEEKEDNIIVYKDSLWKRIIINIKNLFLRS